eukprot:TRINITY_DN1343_c0_g1_i3.p1 TRINITY_DN1343_c0_g1~~TRINITY_DN1343_c0_g1_i3.p1  ORF type:complete len:182 (-),score=45.49 TRINITY_DN1343_c0_g1_i3:158-703(-)
MPRGTMVRWHDDKGFGFIKPNDGSDDVFCHVSALLDGDGSVRDGDEVSFKVEYDDRKGKDRAKDVERVGGGGGGGSRSRSPPPRRSSPPPRRGGGGGGGGGGQESRPGDWDCPNCGFMVFASKDTCFKCGEPKPGTGRGGRDSRDRGRGRGGGRDDRRGGGRDDRRGGRDDDRRRRRSYSR